MTEPDLSLFGFARPAFSIVDRFMAAGLAPLPRVIAWGVLMAVLAMFLYRLMSPQRRLAELWSRAAASRRQIAGFDGELADLLPLVRGSLALSFRQIGTITVPALIASLPLIACLVWLDSAYGYRTPDAAEAVRVDVTPENELLRAHPESALRRDPGGWRVSWPGPGDDVELRDRQGTTIARLGGAPGSRVIEPRHWWNTLFGNPLGYLPASSPVERLDLQLAPRELIGIGPTWLRGWAAPFFLSLVVISILVKVVFRIE